MRVAIPAFLLILLAGCETTNSDEWNGGNGTPFNQAERSCGELTESIGEAADRREFFIGCMQSLGWSPKPGVQIDL